MIFSGIITMISVETTIKRHRFFVAMPSLLTDFPRSLFGIPKDYMDFADTMSRKYSWMRLSSFSSGWKAVTSCAP